MVLLVLDRTGIPVRLGGKFGVTDGLQLYIFCLDGIAFQSTANIAFGI